MNGRRFLLLVATLPLLHCDCELNGNPDANVYACETNADCARGFECLSFRCLPEGTPRPDGGAAGGAETHFSATLRFTSPPRTAEVDACSAPVSFGFRDDAGVPITSPTDIEVTASALDLSLFSDPTCLTGQGTFAVRNEGTLYFRGSRTGTFTIRLTGTSLEPAIQTQTVGQPRRLVFTNPAFSPSLAGSCVQGLTVELRDSTGAAMPAPSGGLALDLTSQPAGLVFSPGNGCIPGAVSIAAGDTSATFSVSSPSGRDYVVNAAAPGFMAATLAVPVRPLVRAGACDLSASEHVKTCAVSPPVLDTSRSFLVYQSSATDHDPSRASVACVLGDAGSVTCQRLLDGGTARVSWHAAELAGARVDRYEVACNPDGGRISTVQLAASVQPSRHFILNAVTSQGVELTGNDFFTLTPRADEVDVQWGADGCGARRLQLQVVQVPGFTTSRDTGSLVGTYSADVTGLPAPDGGVLALATWRAATPGGGENRVCDRMVRAATTGATSVRVSRAAGNEISQCAEFDVEAWGVERVDLGRRATVQELNVTLDAGVGSATRTIAAVDVTRTLLLASGQSGGGGQGAGEGAYPVDGGGFLGEATATLKLNGPTEVQVERAGTRAAATFTVYVVQLEP
ncbi:MAG: hypothetical protein JNK82_18345 [Myxococcaceae bacterium]|nr:hypothetical protein [Myxococcaceae bacterium]